MGGNGRLLIIILLALTLSALGQALGPTLIGRAIDQYITLSDGMAWPKPCCCWRRLICSATLALWARFASWGGCLSAFCCECAGDIFAHVQRLGLDYFYKHGAGDLMSRLVNDTDAIGSLFSQSLVQSLGSLFGLMAVLIAMLVLDIRLALVTILVLPIMIATTATFRAVRAWPTAKRGAHWGTCPNIWKKI